jgi:hypothetical protein
VVDFEEMSMSEIADWAAGLPQEVKFQSIKGAHRRLYDLAYFQHSVDERDRRHAATLIGGLNESIESAVADLPQRLAAFRELMEFFESDIRLRGVGSLRWLLDDQKVPPEKILPFIMRPEHGPKLAAFLELIATEVPRWKPQLIRELVLQRHGKAYPNTVIQLHGLAGSGDSATGAVFTEKELKLLIEAPYQYQSAREVLAVLGLLPIEPRALPLIPEPEEAVLKILVGQTAIDTLTEAPPELLEPVPPPRGMEGLDRLVPLALCLHLGLTMIESLYGPEPKFLVLDGIEALFREAADNGLLKLVGMMRNFERFALDDKINKSRRFSVDSMMFFAAWQEFDLWPDEEAAWDSMQPYLAYVSRLLRHTRTQYLIRLRSRLRFDVHKRHLTPQEIPIAEDLIESDV